MTWKEFGNLIRNPEKYEAAVIALTPCEHVMNPVPPDVTFMGCPIYFDCTCEQNEVLVVYERNPEDDPRRNLPTAQA